MGGRLAPHLSYKSAIVLLPPSSITAPIEAVRRLHDRHHARWPPHINLVYPFLASPSEAIEQGDGTQELPRRLKEDIRARIEAAIKPFQPFHVSLSADPPSTFVHSKVSRTVWLDPSSETVERLGAALSCEFAECSVLHGSPFSPHLSVGQAYNDTSWRNLKSDILKNVSQFLSARDKPGPAALDWYVDKIFVIERKGFHDRFQVVGEVELPLDANTDEAI